MRSSTLTLSSLALLALAAGLGCGRLGGSALPPAGGGGGTSAVATGSSAESFREIERGSQTGVRAGAGADERVLRDAAAWQALWTEHTSIGFPPPALPPVDFGREIVIAVFQGLKPTSGYEIRVDRIERTAPADDLVVSLVEIEPDPSAISLTVMTTPHHFVRVAKNAGTVRFERTRGAALTTLARGAASGYRYGDPLFGGEVRLERDVAGFDALWQLHVSNVFPPPPPPAVDFSTAAVVAAFQGFRPSSGYGIEVLSGEIDPRTGDLAVDVLRVETPGPLTVVTNPYHLVSVYPRPAGGLVPRAAALAPVTIVDDGNVSRRRYGDATDAGARLVIDDAATFAAVWAEHTSGASAPPAVDFASEVVVAAFLGYRPSGGYAVAIERAAALASGNVLLRLQATEPAPGQPVPLLITNPFVIARLQRPKGAVFFE